MKDKNCFVMTRPLWSDLATKYGHYWYEIVKMDALALGMNVIDLEGELARKVPFTNALLTNDPIYFSGCGHGNAEIFSGQEVEYLMQVGEGSELMAGRICYLLSCLTAGALGPDIIDKGGLAYLGYLPLYSWSIERGSDIPTDEYDKAFMDTSNAICMLIARNAMTDFAKQVCLELAAAWFDWWEHNPGGGTPLMLLVQDYLSDDDPLRHYGVPSKRDPTLDIHTPVLQVIRPTKPMALENMEIKIAITCPQGCSLVGQHVKIIDHMGTEFEIEITSQQNGVNYSDYHYLLAPETGLYTWRAVYEGDGIHDPQETSWSFISLIYIDVRGKVTDKETGAPLAYVDIVSDDFGKGWASTDLEGNYSYQGAAMAGATLNIRANRTYYYTLNKSLIAYISGSYTLDFQLVKSQTPPQRTLTINSSAGGATNPVPGAYTHDDAAVVKIIAIPEPGYRFVEWQEV